MGHRLTPTCDVAVVGGGIVGAACAFALRREGRSVLLVDRGEPERAASWGNAGHFAYEQIFPLATTALWRQMPRLLFAKQSPLRIPPRNLAEIAPWLARFAWNTRPSQMRRATAALASLLTLAPEAWDRLTRAGGWRPLLRTGPVLVVARDDAALMGKRPTIDAFRQHGIAVEELSPGAARAIEPMLRADIAGAFVYPDAHYTVDPAKLTRRLIDAYGGAGGTVACDEVRAVALAPDGAVSIFGSATTWTVRQCVVAAGLGSRAILRTLGIAVPLIAERGYHLMVPYRDGSPAVRVPIIGARPEFVITPMEEGTRLAGTVELAASEARPDWRRAAMLEELARELIEPFEAGRDATQWMGCRPSLPDSLPVIGPIASARTLFGAFGHQHLGLTLAAITADIVCALVLRRPPPADIAPFALSRF